MCTRGSIRQVTAAGWRLVHNSPQGFRRYQEDAMGGGRSNRNLNSLIVCEGRVT